jgi:ABC transporter, permease protein
LSGLVEKPARISQSPELEVSILKKLQRRRILLSLLPLAILLCFVYGYSLVTVLFSAFTGFTGSSAGKFVGMKNFQLIFKDIWPTVKITLIWTFGSVLPAMVAGLALAVFCNRNFKGKKAAVSINLIPYAIPLIIVASCWRFVYNPDFGVLNVLLSKLGLIEKPISFLGFDLALLSVIIARIWRAMPFAFMNYYSALTTIPKDLYEAAAIDGASPSQAFWNITMPHLRTTTSSTLLVLTVWTFMVFDIIFGMTGGGPVNATKTLPMRIYQEMFGMKNLGTASAWSLIAIGVLVIITILYWNMDKEDKS